jgi:site-specific recombinase XerD
MQSDFELIAEWISHLRARGLAETTIRSYTVGIQRFGTEVVCGPILSATPQQIDIFLASISKHASQKVMYARGFHSFYGLAHRRGLIMADPTIDVHVKEPEHLPAVSLTEEELIRLMIAAWWRAPQRAWALMLSFSIGCRRSELAGIAPGDILGDKVRLTTTKGNRPRLVELNSLALQALEELKPWYTERSVLGGVCPQTVTEWAHEAASDAGLLDKVYRRSHHILRASFATHLLNSGTPIHVVRDLMGHRSIATTQVYLAAMDPQRRAAVESLPFAS